MNNSDFNDIDRPTRQMKRRLKIWTFLGMGIILAFIIVAMIKVSVIDAKDYQSWANSQQLKKVKIPSSRGSIYDSNGQLFAQSATVYTVFVDPRNLKKDYLEPKNLKIDSLKKQLEKGGDAEEIKKIQEELEKTKDSDESLDMLVDFLAETLELDPETVRAKCTKETQYEILKKNVDNKVMVEINEFLNENDLGGISSEVSSKRYYPQNEMLGSVVGYLDYEGSGVYGLEAYYDDYLSGTDGMTVTAKAENGMEIPYRYKSSYDAKNGDDLYLNIDINIQYYLEKAMSEAYSEHKPGDRMCGIIMNCKTGQVYAMATTTGFDPNQPSDVYDKMLAAELSALNKESDEYKKKIEEARGKQWTNKAVCESYTPGSVFKIITASSALEEKTITTESTFSCGSNASFTVMDTTFSCWTSPANNHGVQNIYDAMKNSCNPVFIQVGQTLGVDKFFKYFESYGFTERTGIDLPGEITGIYHGADMTPVDLAACSFGQGNTVTPIQMITAASAVVNGGYLVTPQVVDKITDPDGNIVEDYERVVKRQVISEDTSVLMREILQYVVDQSPGSNCYIQGYKIGGKSGTSQKLTISADTYVASYCAFAPADDPEVIMLLMVDEPNGASYYGSEVAAPVCVDVLSDVLPYMGYFPEYTEEELEKVAISVPNVEYTDIEDAKKTLQNNDLKPIVVGNGKNVVHQMPVSGSTSRGSTVVLYTDENYSPEMTNVPPISELTVEEAKKALADAGLNLNPNGAAAFEEGAIAGYDQSVGVGQSVEKGTVVSVTFNSSTISSW